MKLRWVDMATGETGTIEEMKDFLEKGEYPKPNLRTVSSINRSTGTLSIDDMEMKPSNPKDLIGTDKIPFHLWPETASALGAVAILDGNLKYGRTNWRAAGVKASIYYDACRRHLNAWFDEGEDEDPDSGIDHLGHALACIAIIVDAKAANKLTDDRLIKGGYRGFINGLTSKIKTIREKHKGKTPRHYTIADSEEFNEL